MQKRADQYEKDRIGQGKIAQSISGALNLLTPAGKITGPTREERNRQKYEKEDK